MILALFTITASALVREKIRSQSARLMSAKIDRRVVFFQRHNHQPGWLW